MRVRRTYEISADVISGNSPTHSPSSQYDTRPATRPGDTGAYRNGSDSIRISIASLRPDGIAARTDPAAVNAVDSAAPPTTGTCTFSP